MALHTVNFSLEPPLAISYFFFLNDPAPTEIYTLPLHDALPICDLFDLAYIVKGPCVQDLGHRDHSRLGVSSDTVRGAVGQLTQVLQIRFALFFEMENLRELPEDRKSTRLNSSHGYISYAVFCLK